MNRRTWDTGVVVGRRGRLRQIVFDLYNVMSGEKILGILGA